MKLLLDENLLKRLKRDLVNHDVFHISDKKWQGLKNGELLKKLMAENFDALITIDKNLSHLQNFNKYPISVLIIMASDNTYPTLSPFVLKFYKF
jgi:predicted nuclease of predicted toxin-antitoxin system